MNLPQPNSSAEPGFPRPSGPLHAPRYRGAPPRAPSHGGSSRAGRSGAWRGGSRPPHPRRPRRTRVEHHPRSSRAPAPSIPECAADSIRIIPLGGVEEIGRNMTIVEFGPSKELGTNGDIFILDCGFHFREEETPGVAYILPTTAYLEERRDKIRGLFISP